MELTYNSTWAFEVKILLHQVGIRRDEPPQIYYRTSDLSDKII